MKTLLILVDGMRPDALTDIPYAQELRSESVSSMCASTVFPSVTLPCHMSLFHSVDPDRHGVTTNTYTPSVRPIDGLCERLHEAGKTCELFFNWEEIRDLSRPGSLSGSYFYSGRVYTYEKANEKLTDAVIKKIETEAPDFIFLYFGLTDAVGHSHGWLSKEYMDAIKQSWAEIKRIKEALPNDYSLIVTADHGGHARSHGTTQPEDMTIPVFFCGEPFEKGAQLDDVNIKDIAPTIVKIMGASPAPEWEGKSII